MTQKTFSKSDIKKFLDAWPAAADFITKKSHVLQKDDILIVDRTPLFFHFHGVWIPTLKLLLKYPAFLPKVVVDKGAIRFVVNGADIMRPGITAADEFVEGAIVVIVDETVGKPLAVGKALFSSDVLLEKESGKSVRTLHYVSDDIWNA